jgi:hypothetical protein
MFQNSTSKDMRFDYPFRNICSYDGCRIDMRYTNPRKSQVLNNNRYCSKACLDKQYQGLGIDGAVHLIHQTFGPTHPVTKQIQKMRVELADLRKDTDYLDKVGRGHEHEDKNFKKLCHMTEKCL